METNLDKWEGEFDEQFPLPEHERITKCFCLDYEEHAMHFRWFADPEEVKAFIQSLLHQRTEEIINDIPSGLLKANTWGGLIDVSEEIKDSLRSKYLTNGKGTK